MKADIVVLIIKLVTYYILLLFFFKSVYTYTCLTVLVWLCLFLCTIYW